MSGIFSGAAVTDGMSWSIGTPIVEFEAICFAKSSAFALEVDKLISFPIEV